MSAFEAGAVRALGLVSDETDRLALDFPDGESRCVWPEGRGAHRVYRHLVKMGVCREGERKGAFYLTPLGVRVVKHLLDSQRKTSP